MSRSVQGNDLVGVDIQPVHQDLNEGGEHVERVAAIAVRRRESLPNDLVVEMQGRVHAETAQGDVPGRALALKQRTAAAGRPEF